MCTLWSTRSQISREMNSKSNTDIIKAGRWRMASKRLPSCCRPAPCFKERQTTLSVPEGVNFIHLYTFEATEGLLSYQRTYP